MFASLCDRLLSRVVPETKASANPYCWYEYSGPLCRYCCDVPGPVDRVQCNNFRPC